MATPRCDLYWVTDFSLSWRFTPQARLEVVEIIRALGETPSFGAVAPGLRLRVDFNPTAVYGEITLEAGVSWREKGVEMGRITKQVRLFVARFCEHWTRVEGCPITVSLKLI